MVRQEFAGGDFIQTIASPLYSRNFDQTVYILVKTRNRTVLCSDFSRIMLAIESQNNTISAKNWHRSRAEMTFL